MFNIRAFMRIFSITCVSKIQETLSFLQSAEKMRGKFTLMRPNKKSLMSLLWDTELNKYFKLWRMILKQHWLFYFAIQNHIRIKNDSHFSYHTYRIFFQTLPLFIIQVLMSRCSSSNVYLVSQYQRVLCTYNSNMYKCVSMR